MANNTQFVLVHGAWHGAACWQTLLPYISGKSTSAVALNLPGAGPNAKSPKSFFQRPLDPAQFGTEPSPNAGVTQEERTTAVIATIDEIIGESGDKVILVGHSLGGLTVSAVAEAAPEKIAAVVYLTAFMLPPGMPAIAMIQHEKMAGELVGPRFMADPQVIGALRLDVGSDDPEYLSGLKAAFYGDLSEEQFQATLVGLHCDEPAGVAVTPGTTTRERFGQVPRYYIRCENDFAVMPAGQDFMIGAVDEAMGNATQVYTLPCSHSPFISAPEELADILTNIAAQ